MIDQATIEKYWDTMIKSVSRPHPDGATIVEAESSRPKRFLFNFDGSWEVQHQVRCGKNAVPTWRRMKCEHVNVRLLSAALRARDTFEEKALKLGALIDKLATER